MIKIKNITKKLKRTLCLALATAVAASVTPIISFAASEADVRAAVEGSIETANEEMTEYQITVSTNEENSSVLNVMIGDGDNVQLKAIALRGFFNTLFHQQAVGIAQVTFKHAPATTSIASNPYTFKGKALLDGLSLCYDFLGEIGAVYPDCSVWQNGVIEPNSPLSAIDGTRAEITLQDAGGQTLNVPYTIEFFLKDHNVKINYGEEETTTVKKAYNDSLSEELDPEKHPAEGKKIVGWTKTYTDFDKELKTEEITDIANEKMGKFDVTYTAKWAEVKNVKFNHKNETEGSDTVEQMKGQNWVFPETDPKWENHTFEGWFKEESGGTRIQQTDKYDGTTEEVYAHWVTNGYNVNFYNGDTTVKQLVTTQLKSGDFPNVEPKKGYKFTGWRKGKDGETVQAGDYPITEETDFYAAFDKIEYQITYEMNGENAVNNESNRSTYTVEDAVTLAPPTRPGYNFGGWKESVEGAEETDAGKVVSFSGETGNRKYTATWEPVTYRIKYSPGSEDVTDPKAMSVYFDVICTYGVPKKLSTNLYIRKGYVFAGWKADNGDDTIYEDEGEILNLADTQDVEVTLVAQWTKKVCGISFDVNPTLGQQTKYYPQIPGKAPNTGFENGRYLSTTFTYGEALTEDNFPELVRLGYTLDGWYDEKSGKQIKPGTNPVEEFPDFDWEKHSYIFTARWTARNDMPFNVEYRLEKADGSLEARIVKFNAGNVEKAVDYNELKDKLGEDGQPLKRDFEGYLFMDETNDSGDPVYGIWRNSIDSNPSLVLRYKLKTYKVTFNVQGKAPVTTTYKYGQEIEPPDVSDIVGDEHRGIKNAKWDREIPKIANDDTLSSDEDNVFNYSYDEYYEAYIGDVQYASLKGALEKAPKGSVVRPVPNLTLTEDITVPEGVTLLLPTDEDDKNGYVSTSDGLFNPDWTDVNNTHGVLGVWSEAKLYGRLIVPAERKITVLGTVLVNAVTGRPHAGHYDMDITGGYGQIDLDGNITVQSGGILDVCGYIKGSGTVTVEQGGEVRDLYVVRNWRGGNQALDIYPYVYPMNQADMHNIEVNTVVESGGILSGTVKMYASGGYHRTHFPQVDSANGLIRLSGGSVTKTLIPKEQTATKYEAREKLVLSGSGTSSYSALEIVGTEMSTGDFLYPIDGDMDIDVNGNWLITDKLKFMPGAIVTIKENSSVTIDKETKRSQDKHSEHEYEPIVGNGVVFYDDSFDDKMASTAFNGTSYPSEARGDAKLILESGATLTANGSFGGKIEIAEGVSKETPVTVTFNDGVSVTSQEADPYSTADPPVKDLTFSATIDGCGVNSGVTYKCWKEDGKTVIEGTGTKSQEYVYDKTVKVWDGTGTYEYYKDGSDESEEPINVGEYSVRRETETDTYKLSETVGTLEINPLTAEFKIEVDEFEYDNSEKSVIVTVSNAKEGDEVTAVVAGEATAKDVGTHTVTVTGLEGASKDNYTLEDSASTTLEWRIKESDPTPSVDPSPTPDKPGELIGIRIKTQPSKSEITEGMALDLSGMVVEAQYSNNTSAVIEDYTISGYEPNKTGVQTITIEYNGFKAELKITVVEKTLTEILITQKPNRRAYIQGEQLDTEGMIVTGIYNNGTTAELSGYEVSGYSADVVGTQTITVLYGEFTAAFIVTVSEAQSSEAVAAPVLNIESFIGGKRVALTCLTPEADIYYTTDGSAPTASDNKYTEPITLTETTVIKAVAIKGVNNSQAVSGKISVSAVETPFSSHRAGQLDADTIITLQSDTGGATIYYTTDGSEPTVEGGTRYNGAIVVSSDMTIKAIAVKDGYKSSDTYEVKYTVSPKQSNSVTVSVGSATTAAGERVSVPIYIFADSDITDYRLSLTYDSSKFEYISVSPVEGVSSADLFTSSAGNTINILYSGAAIESGEVFNVNLNVLSSATDGEYPINVSNIKITTVASNDYTIGTVNGAITLSGSKNSNLNVTTDTVITDSEGNAVDKDSISGEVTANVTVDDIKGAPADGVPLLANIILAVYDRNGTLITTSIMKADLSDANYVFTNTIDIPENVSVGSIKLMIWNDLGDMAPMSDVNQIL